MAKQTGMTLGTALTQRTPGWSTWQCAEGKQSSWTWCYVMSFMAVVLCLFVTCLILLLSAGSDDGPTTQDADEMDGGMARPPYIVVYVPATTPPTSTSTSTTTSPAPVVPMPKVCTIDGGGLQSFLLPADGVCSFVFYHPLRIRENTNTFNTQEQTTLQPFFDRAQHSSSTRYGMSVNLSDASKLRRGFQTHEGKQDYESYWNVRIYDWGFLFIDEFQAEALSHAIFSALSVLKFNVCSAVIYKATCSDKEGATLEMQEYLQSKRHDQVFMFMGMYARSDTLCAEVAQRMNSIFTPAGVIILGHLSYHDTERSDCAVLPPTNLHDPHFRGGVSYGHSIRDAVHMVKCLRQYDVRTNFSVSVTLRGRWSRPKSFTGQSSFVSVHFYDECQSSAYREVAALGSICDDPNGLYAKNLAYDKDTKAVITFNQNQGYAFTFDNEKSLLEKICDAWNGVADVQLGIAVYDVLHDGRDTKCDSKWIVGRWSRLRFLIRLSAFLEENYRNPDVKRTCNHFL